MVQVGTLVKVTDKTGIVLAVCIKVFGPMRKRIAFLGDVILVSVKKFNLKKIALGKVKKRRKFFKGSLVRGLLVRTKVNFCRMPGIYIKFNENTIVIVNKKVVPISNRVFGPILRELCIKWPSLGCMTRYIF